jgi:hypothetical protein
MNEAEVLAWLEESGERDCYALLVEKMPTMDKRMTKAVKALAALLKEVQQEFPDAQFYTGSGGLILMLGNPHSQGGANPQTQLAAAGFSHLISIGDGDF